MHRTSKKDTFRFVPSLLLISLISLVITPRSYGQVIANPNQIVGTIEFTNTNPQILDLLEPAPGDDEGFRTVFLVANSLGLTPQLNSSTTFTATGRTSTLYEITVESALPGIQYEVAVDMRLDFGGERYDFARITTDPVEPEGSPDVVANFSECAGLLDIRWVTTSGNPATVDGGFLVAARETAPGSNSFPVGQAIDFGIDRGSGQEYLAVRGDGSRYQVDVVYQLGTDPGHDTVRLQRRFFTPVSCDEIVQLTVVVPEVGDLGTIVGQIDMLGEFETAPPLVIADGGPFGNRRVDRFGNFELENLLPGPYRVVGNLSFRQQEFRAPFLEGSNGRVPVTAGDIVDLADTFVIDPGFVTGEIFLAGPAPDALGSCLEDVTASSAIEATGIDELALGATKSAFGGLTSTPL